MHDFPDAWSKHACMHGSTQAAHWARRGAQCTLCLGRARLQGTGPLADCFTLSFRSASLCAAWARAASRCAWQWVQACRRACCSPWHGCMLPGSMHACAWMPACMFGPVRTHACMHAHMMPLRETVRRHFSVPACRHISPAIACLCTVPPMAMLAMVPYSSTDCCGHRRGYPQAFVACACHAEPMP